MLQVQIETSQQRCYRQYLKLYMQNWLPDQYFNRLFRVLEENDRLFEIWLRKYDGRCNPKQIEGYKFNGNSLKDRERLHWRVVGLSWNTGIWHVVSIHENSQLGKSKWAHCHVPKHMEWNAIHYGVLILKIWK